LDAPDASEFTPYGVSRATVKVYAVPFVNPETVIGEVELVPVILPGVDVALYVPEPVLPAYVEAVNATVALALPAVAVPIVGVVGFLP
jgi:hypothetical protein